MNRRTPEFVLRVIVAGAVCLMAGGAGAGCRARGGAPVQASLEVPQDQLDPMPPQPSLGPLNPPQALATVEAMVAPPVGWRADPLKTSDRHNHQVWISPSGSTAYGVIRFKLPLPVNADLALRYGILPEMRRTEGEAHLISSERDASLPGLRFVAEGGLYRLRTNLITRGWRGWAVYAGTLRQKEIVPDELALAEMAREHTTVGLKR